MPGTARPYPRRVDADRERATQRNRALAAHTAIADAIAPLIDPAGRVIVGHSFGGAIAVFLAGRPGVVGVGGLGIKVAWTGEELAGAAKRARRMPRIELTRAAAVERHLRLSGLQGLAAAGSMPCQRLLLARSRAWPTS
jgi:pimeloyl-ACP methyl ester carboxylesterase